MSIEMLKVANVTDPLRVTSIPRLDKVKPVVEDVKGNEVAAKGEALPHEEPNQSTKVEQAVNQMNQFVQTLNRDLQFSVDEDSGRTVVKVLDTETKEVIRQIPSEELLRMANYLTDGGALLLKVQA